jgi:hypothetical protein
MGPFERALKLFKALKTLGNHSVINALLVENEFANVTKNFFTFEIFEFYIESWNIPISENFHHVIPKNCELLNLLFDVVVPEFCFIVCEV